MLRFVKEALPMPVRLFIRRLRWRIHLQKNTDRSSAEVFSEIYRTQSWAPHLKLSPGALYSGPGSDEELGRPYAAEIVKYIHTNNIRAVVDLGCGDFRVGRLIAAEGISYTGVDVVPAVIAHNRANFENENIRFLCRDIARDELPDGDLCLVREVFQHMSNPQIESALRAMRKYRHVIVTDHQLGETASRPINVDRPHGHASRSALGTNLDLTKKPFQVKGVNMIFEFPAHTPGLPDGFIRGFAYTN